MRAARRCLRALVAIGAAAALTACSGGPAPAIGPSAGIDSPAPGGTVRDYTLTAAASTLELKPGLTVHAWSYNGTSPGPELRATAGDLVRVRLRNRLAVGTTIHWHGIDLPNGQDGVAGITQDAIPPGGTTVYSFRVMEAGTYWYHAHQDSSVQQDRGLYGALVVLPRGPATSGVDRTLVYGEWSLGLEAANPPARANIAMRSYVTTSVNGRTGSAIMPIATTPGEQVRLRLVNASYQVHYLESPVPVTIAALDGHELIGGSQITGAIPFGPAERVDLVFAAPAQPISLRLVGGFPPDEDAMQPIGPTGAPGPPMAAPTHRQLLDLLGLSSSPAAGAGDPWSDGKQATRSFTMTLSEVRASAGSAPPGAMPGMAGMDGVSYRIDGKTFPATPVLRITRGDLVEITFRNQGGSEHWMHLHGHFFRVLLRDGAPLPGRLVKDTVGVPPGHSVTIAFRADNPGWWMIHCHQLLHAAGGMMALLAYDGAVRPAQLGGPFSNSPD